jgi:hypothetical protein
MPWTRLSSGCDQQLPIGANRLKAVMFDPHRFSAGHTQKQRQKRWAGQMDQVGFFDQSGQGTEPRAPDDAKRQIQIVHCAGGRASGQRHFPAGRGGGDSTG